MINLFIRRFSQKVTGLPFQIDRSQAIKILIGSKNIFEKGNTIESIESLDWKSDPITKTYIPFHSANIFNLTSSYVAEYGIDRTEYYTYLAYNHQLKTFMPQTGSRTVTDWYSVSGITNPIDYPFGTLETQIYAGFKYSRKNIESALRTNDVTAISNCMISENTSVDTHNMHLSFAVEKIIVSLNKFEENNIKKFIKEKSGADSVKIKELNMHLNTAHIELKSYHIPAFIYTYKIDDSVFYKFVNGYNGKTEGDKLYSPVKVGTAIGTIGTVFGIIANIGLSLAPQALLLRIVLLGISIGIPSGFITSIYSKYTHNKKYDEINKEKEYNNTSFNDENDTGKKYESNDSHDDTKLSKLSKLYDECRLLGLNNMNDITIDQLKKARAREIKKWHPDVYKNNSGEINEELANNMTKRINDAYYKISKALKL